MRRQAAARPSFVGAGATLSGRPAAAAAQAASTSEAAPAEPATDHWAALGGGTKLATGRADRMGGGVAAPIAVDDDDDDDGSEFNGFSDDDDAIVIDSD